MKVDGRQSFAFAMLLALLSTSLFYRFGTDSHYEHIPIVMRQLDPGFLVNDFFVSSSAEFGPRLYFAKTLAWVSHILPLPWTYLVFRFLGDLLLVLVTQWAARSIIGADRLGASIASVLVLAVSSFHLGDATNLRYENFSPASLSIPGMLLAVGLGLQGRAIAAALVASLSSLPHPLYGIEGGAIALGTAFFVLLLPGAGLRPPPSETNDPQAPLAWGRATAQTGAGIAILLAAFALFWWLPNRTTGVTMSTEQLFEVLGRFRAPHHYLPSRFRPQDYVTTGVFILATLLAYREWALDLMPRTARIVLLPVLAVLCGCLVGTVFTEFWPVKGILTLQTFRLLSVLKWIGYLLIGSVLAHYWQRPPNSIARPIVGMSLLSSGGTYPLVTAAGLSLIRLWGLPSHAGRKVCIGLMAAGTAGLWLLFGSLNEVLLVALALPLVAAFSASSRTLRVAAGLVTIAFVLMLAGNRAGNPTVNLAAFTPVFDLSDLQDEASQAARAAANLTRPDALFVAPPDFGVLRIVGKRALVVDFEALPFQDHAMLEWRERIRAVYGDVKGGGVIARHELDDAYRMITDSHLRALADRYGATHAVLYADTPTGLPELYVNDAYRIVQLRSE